MTSLVVVTWESRTDLARLVDSMLAHLEPHHELIVVDNASSDEPEAELERWPGPRRLERLASNRGFGTAANAGIAAAANEGVVILNPDTELLDGRIADLAAAAVEWRALVGPRLLNPDRTPQPSASGPVVGAWPWIGAVAPGALQPGPIKARTEPWRLQRQTEVAWLTGACIAGPRQTLLELGPFDGRIELLHEDLDLCLRASVTGVPVVFAPELCEVIHHGGTAMRRRFDDAGLELSARNRRQVVARAYGPGRERRSQRAQLLRLRLRVAAKTILRRDRDAELAEIRAARAAAPPRP